VSAKGHTAAREPDRRHKSPATIHLFWLQIGQFFDVAHFFVSQAMISALSSADRSSATLYAPPSQ
jgi:hypothetical protein